MLGTGHENFKVNSSSLSIVSSSNGSFDRESVTIFYFKITARDVDGLVSTANLAVVVDDVNDNKPTFNVSQSIVTVNESSSIGYNLMLITAYDKDYGSNSELSYTMQGGDEKFIYNHTTGGLSTAKSRRLSNTLVNCLNFHHKASFPCNCSYSPMHRR